MELRKSYLTRSYQQELRPRAKIFFLKGGWEGSGPNSNFSKLLKLFETSAARKLILALLINIHKANGRRYDVTRLMVYRGISKDPQSAHYCTTVYSLRSQVQVNEIFMLFLVHWLSMYKRK